MNQRRLFDETVGSYSVEILVFLIDTPNQTLGALRQRLAPFFTIDHATRGPVAGPWARLPEYTQQLALDTVSSLCQGGGEGVGGLSTAVERASAGKKLADYWQYVRPTLQA